MADCKQCGGSGVCESIGGERDETWSDPCDYCSEAQFTAADLDAAVAAERTRCLAECGRVFTQESPPSDYDRGYAAALKHVDDAIRARGAK